MMEFSCMPGVPVYEFAASAVAMRHKVAEDFVAPAAVEAAAEAMIRRRLGAAWRPGLAIDYVPDATAALTAAAPILLAAHEAQVRAQVAAEIQAEARQVLTDDDCGRIERNALLLAAHIANPGKD